MDRCLDAPCDGLEAERVQYVVRHTRICLQRVDVERVVDRIAADVVQLSLVRAVGQTDRDDADASILELLGGIR